ncbi:hypothetical protein ABIB85_005502 [Bradyrhizobium sp. JR1.5]|uniref:hypothetical protein n=1 Tax=unclassified Bradyrhizobium TaxID=2631580 RepID=UPI003395A8B7
MPKPEEINQDWAQAMAADSNRMSTSPDLRDPNAQPTGGDIVVALANSPLAGIEIARLSIRPTVRSEPRDMDEWF